MYSPDMQSVPGYLANRLSNIGLIRIFDAKTKFSQIRVYVRFGADSVSELIPYGIMYGLRFDKLFGYNFFKLPYYKLDRVSVPSFVNYFLVPYQKFVYRQVYKHVIKKFPRYRENLLDGADYPELLRNL